MKEQVTISLDAGVLALLRDEVKRGRASDLSAAIERSLPRPPCPDGLRKALDLWEEEFGPIGQEAEHWARRELERARTEISSAPDQL